MARSQSPVVASYADVAIHAKTIHLCSLLHIGRAEGVGLLHCLWHYCTRVSPEHGSIDCSCETLAEDMYWHGDPYDLWGALIDSGYLDIDADGHGKAHEWAIYALDAQQLNRKRRYDRRRLKTLRGQEQLSLAIELPGAPAPGSPQEAELPEPMRIHAALIPAVDGKLLLPNDLRRINRTLELFPTTSGYDVALNYIAWQLDVANDYMRNKKGVKPHTDAIRGWGNQMRMHADKGWSPRPIPFQASPYLDFSAEDAARYT